MESWLRTNADTPGYMLQSLVWIDIACVNATCKSWRDYLSHSSSTFHSVHRAPLIIRHQQLPLAAAIWLATALQSIQLIVDDKTVSNESEAFKSASSLLSFPRLTSLQLKWPTRFLSTNLFELLGRVKELRSLRITLDTHHYLDSKVIQQLISSFRLTALQNCPHLATLHLTRETFIPSLLQIHDLAACKSLTDLSFGTWSEYPSNLDSTSSGGSFSDFLAHSKLRKMDCDDWRVLSEMPTLTSLTLKPSGSYQYHLNRLSWKPLLRFTNLKELEFNMPVSHSTPAKSPLPDFWASLVQCPSITSLKLGFLNLQNSELTQLFQSLPHLQSLSFAKVEFESCSVFIHAPKSLKKLRFEECHTFPQKPIFYHLCLPTIPQLEDLQIRDSWLHYIIMGKHDCWRAECERDELNGEDEEDEDNYDCNSDPVYAVKEAFSFMLKGRMPNIKNTSVFY